MGKNTGKEGREQTVQKKVGKRVKNRWWSESNEGK